MLFFLSGNLYRFEYELYFISLFLHVSAGHSNPACFGKFLQKEPTGPCKMQHMEEIEKAQARIAQWQRTLEEKYISMKRELESLSDKKSIVD